MIITQTSVSQVESFDHDQKGGCERKFWFERVNDLRPDQNAAQSDGDKGHELLATYLTTGAMPAKKVKMGKAVTGAIVKGELPKPGPDLLVEVRFSEQEKFDVNGKYIPLDTSKTLWLAGIPWDGFIDLAFRRGDIPSIWDHKFGADIHANAKKSDDLIKTVQLPVYVLSQLPYWPDAKLWEIAHHNVSRSGVDSFIRRAIVHIDQVHERRVHIEATVERMKVVAGATSQEDVPFNRRSCELWAGCPHQSICSAYRENKMVISKEDEDLFNELDGVTAEPPVAAVLAPPALQVLATSLQAADTKAAQIARMKADLAAMEAEAAKPPPPPPAPAPAAPVKERKLVAKPLEGVDPIHDSAPASVPTCAKCHTALTAQNASKLTSGLYLHIGCPKDAPVPTVPPDAPASNPALASEAPAAPAAAPRARAPKAPPALGLVLGEQPTAAAPAVAQRPIGCSVTLHFDTRDELKAFFAKF